MSISKGLLDLNWALQRSHTPIAGWSSLYGPQLALWHVQRLAHPAGRAERPWKSTGTTTPVLPALTGSGVAVRFRSYT